MRAARFEQLDVWREAHHLVLQVYEMTKVMPSEERFGLIPQMRRAAVSVPANIAEGFKRLSSKEKAHFYNIAQASLEELRYYFVLCRDLSYTAEFPALDAQTDRVARMLSGLVKAVRS